MDDLLAAVVDEIALDGLEGCSLCRLWHCLERRFHNDACALDNSIKMWIWDFLSELMAATSPRIRAFSCSTLPVVNGIDVWSPQYPLTVQYIEDKTTSTSTVDKPDSSIDEKKKRKIKNDRFMQEGMVVNGSLSKPNWNREDLTAVLYKLPFDEACSLFSEGHIVLVASQEERYRALLSGGSELLNESALTPRVYCALERIGRHRTAGVTHLDIIAAFGGTLTKQDAHYLTTTLSNLGCVARLVSPVAMAVKTTYCYLSRFVAAPNYSLMETVNIQSKCVSTLNEGAQLHYESFIALLQRGTPEIGNLYDWTSNQFSSDQGSAGSLSVFDTDRQRLASAFAADHLFLMNVICTSSRNRKHDNQSTRHVTVKSQYDLNGFISAWKADNMAGDDGIVTWRPVASGEKRKGATDVAHVTGAGGYEISDDQKLLCCIAEAGTKGLLEAEINKVSQVSQKSVVKWLQQLLRVKQVRMVQACDAGRKALTRYVLGEANSTVRSGLPNLRAVSAARSLAAKVSKVSDMKMPTRPGKHVLRRSLPVIKAAPVSSSVEMIIKDMRRVLELRRAGGPSAMQTVLLWASIIRELRTNPKETTNKQMAIKMVTATRVLRHALQLLAQRDDSNFMVHIFPVTIFGTEETFYVAAVADESGDSETVMRALAGEMETYARAFPLTTRSGLKRKFCPKGMTWYELAESITAVLSGDDNGGECVTVEKLQVWAEEIASTRWRHSHVGRVPGDVDKGGLFWMSFNSILTVGDELLALTNGYLPGNRARAEVVHRYLVQRCGDAPVRVLDTWLDLPIALVLKVVGFSAVSVFIDFLVESGGVATTKLNDLSFDNAKWLEKARVNANDVDSNAFSDAFIAALTILHHVGGIVLLRDGVPVTASATSLVPVLPSDAVSIPEKVRLPGGVDVLWANLHVGKAAGACLPVLYEDPIVSSEKNALYAEKIYRSRDARPTWEMTGVHMPLDQLMLVAAENQHDMNWNMLLDSVPLRNKLKWRRPEVLSILAGCRDYRNTTVFLDDCSEETNRNLWASIMLHVPGIVYKLQIRALTMHMDDDDRDRFSVPSKEARRCMTMRLWDGLGMKASSHNGYKPHELAEIPLSQRLKAVQKREREKAENEPLSLYLESLRESRDIEESGKRSKSGAHYKKSKKRFASSSSEDEDLWLPSTSEKSKRKYTRHHPRKHVRTAASSSISALSPSKRTHSPMDIDTLLVDSSDADYIIEDTLGDEPIDEYNDDDLRPCGAVVDDAYVAFVDDSESDTPHVMDGTAASDDDDDDEHDDDECDDDGEVKGEKTILWHQSDLAVSDSALLADLFGVAIALNTLFNKKSKIKRVSDVSNDLSFVPVMPSLGLTAAVVAQADVTEVLDIDFERTERVVVPFKLWSLLENIMHDLHRQLPHGTYQSVELRRLLMESATTDPSCLSRVSVACNAALLHGFLNVDDIISSSQVLKTTHILETYARLCRPCINYPIKLSVLPSTLAELASTYRVFARPASVDCYDDAVALLNATTVGTPFDEFVSDVGAKPSALQRRPGDAMLYVDVVESTKSKFKVGKSTTTESQSSVLPSINVPVPVQLAEGVMRDVLISLSFNMLSERRTKQATGVMLELFRMAFPAGVVAQTMANLADSEFAVPQKNRCSRAIVAATRNVSLAPNTLDDASHLCYDITNSSVGTAVPVDVPTSSGGVSLSIADCSARGAVDFGVTSLGMHATSLDSSNGSSDDDFNSSKGLNRTRRRNVSRYPAPLQMYSSPREAVEYRATDHEVNDLPIMNSIDVGDLSDLRRPYSAISATWTPAAAINSIVMDAWHGYRGPNDIDAILLNTVFEAVRTGGTVGILRSSLSMRLAPLPSLTPRRHVNYDGYLTDLVSAGIVWRVGRGEEHLVTRDNVTILHARYPVKVGRLQEHARERRRIKSRKASKRSRALNIEARNENTMSCIHAFAPEPWAPWIQADNSISPELHSLSRSALISILNELPGASETSLCRRLRTRYGVASVLMLLAELITDGVVVRHSAPILRSSLWSRSCSESRFGNEEHHYFLTENWLTVGVGYENDIVESNKQ